jgi:NifB/MoaA-like Fe-S oxidoreductase
VDRFNARTGAHLEVVAVENQYLGKEITVSGLLSGQDLLAAFERRPVHGPLFISRRMISDRTGTLLDDRTVESVSDDLRCPVVPADGLSDISRVLRRHRSVASAA